MFIPILKFAAGGAGLLLLLLGAGVSCREGEDLTYGEVESQLRCLVSQDPEVRECARSWLQRQGPSVIPQLVDVARKRSAQFDAVPVALAALGPRAVGHIVTLLEHPDEMVRSAAADALGRLKTTSGKAVKALTVATSDSSEFVRMAATEALGYIGNPSAEVLRRLESLLSDQVRGVREAAANATVRLRKATPGAIAALIGSMVRDDNHSAFLALEALAGELYPYVQQLTAMLDDDGLDVESKHNVALLLGRLGGMAKIAIPDLVALLQTSDPKTRSIAADALAGIGVASVESLLNVVETGGRGAVEAVGALEEIGLRTDRILEALRVSLESEDPELRVAATTALEKLR